MAIPHCPESAAILNSPDTRRFVHELIKVCKGRDILDAVDDLALSAKILDLDFHAFFQAPWSRGAPIRRTAALPEASGKGWDCIEVE